MLVLILGAAFLGKYLGRAELELDVNPVLSMLRNSH